MSSVELWTCDFHAAPEDGEPDYIYEDDCRDKNWLIIERSYKRAIVPGGYEYTFTDTLHVCADCLDYPDCREWLADGGFEGCYAEDQERLAEIVDAITTRD